MSALTKKPGIFLAQMLGQAGCEDLMAAARTVAIMGYQYVQLPPDSFDLAAAADSVGWCQDNLVGPLGELGVGISEVSYHIPGQLMAVHPAYQGLFAGFLPDGVAPTMQGMYDWGVAQTKRVIDVTANLGLSAMVGFTGSLLWPYFYEWPQRPKGLVKEGMLEMARRWAPVIRYAAARGVYAGTEPHPCEDVHDGDTYEMYLEALAEVGVDQADIEYAGINYDPSHLIIQQADEIAFLEAYLERVVAFHVKDAEHTPGKGGVYGGYRPWEKRAGCFRTPGYGQVDFDTIFATLYDEDSVADAKIVPVVEWEDPRQDAIQGARHAQYYLAHGERPNETVIPPKKSFDDFAASGAVDFADLIGVGTIAIPESL